MLMLYLSVGITTIVLDAKLQKEKLKDLTIVFKNEIINCPGGCLYGRGPVL